ncbi:MAG: BACON domain-containing protein, partial [Verrucomicrobiota bacterium]
NPNTTTRSATLTVGTQTCVLTQAASPFAAWAAGLPQNNQGFTQDADHDGVSNGVEYALGRDASIASGSNGIAQLPLNTLAGTGSLRHLTMTLSLPLTAPADIVYDVQASNNLTSWTTIMEKSGSGLWSAIGNSGATVVSTPDGSGRSSYAITDAVGYHFMRLAVTSTSAAAPVTTVSATASALYAANSTASVQVTSNTNWTASSNQAWAVVSPSSGSGNGTLTVTCAANATATPRSAVITIGTQTCVLTQAAWPYAIWATNLTQGTQGFGMDADHDGVSNGMEYALGRNAASASGINGIAQLPLITAAGNSASRHLTMTLSLPDPAPVDITYDVEVTNSLSDPWITIMEKAGTGTWAALGNPSATVSSSPAGSGRTAYTITDVQGHHFMRLAVKSL